MGYRRRHPLRRKRGRQVFGIGASPGGLAFAGGVCAEVVKVAALGCDGAQGPTRALRPIPSSDTPYHSYQMSSYVDEPSDDDEIQIVEVSYRPPPVTPGEAQVKEDAMDVPLMPARSVASAKVRDLVEDVLVAAVADVEGRETLATADEEMSEGVGLAPIHDKSGETGANADDSGLVTGGIIGQKWGRDPADRSDERPRGGVMSECAIGCDGAEVPGAACI